MEPTQTINEVIILIYLILVAGLVLLTYAFMKFDVCVFIYCSLQAVYNKKEEFFLFGSVMEATMIDKK